MQTLTILLKYYRHRIDRFLGVLQKLKRLLPLLLNVLELVVSAEDGETVEITNKKVLDRLQNNLAIYDKQGEMHYDIISAFIKSIRGSDPDAAVYWLARMLTGGESLEFIGRRLLIVASEDIGLANPNALLLAQSCFDSIRVIGNP